MNLRLSPSLKTVLAGLGCALACSTGIYAQTPLPANNPDQPMVATPFNMATLSTAMIECPLAGTVLSAIVYSDLNTTELYLDLGAGGSTLLLPVANVVWGAADVAIADDPSFPGQYYHVAVTYRQSIGAVNAPPYDFYVLEYTIDVASGPLTVVSSSAPIPFATNVNMGISPRIDAMIDNTTVGMPIPVINQFILSYMDMAGNTRVEGRDASLTPTYAPQLVATPAGFYPTDVATTIDFSVGAPEPTAFITGIAAGTLYTMAQQLNSSTTSAPIPLLSGTLYNPRIEAFGIYEPSVAPTAKWAIVVDSAHTYIKAFTDLSAAGGFTANPTLGGQHEYPTVAAGPGPHPSIIANIGCRQYSYAWGGSSSVNYYADALDQLGAPINPAFCDIVNQSPSTLTTDPSDLISMSHSCNTGLGTVVAWNEGSQIMYKINTNNGYQFRPGSEDTPKEIVRSTSLYPNPARDYFTVSNTVAGKMLQVSNSLGSTVVETELNDGETKVDIHALPAGYYYVSYPDPSGTPIRYTLTVLR